MGYKSGDTLLDVARWYGLTAKEVADANHGIDWWLPPAGKEIDLPTERILPEGPRVGIVLNIPEMRLYYYYAPGAEKRGKHGRITPRRLARGSGLLISGGPGPL